ncbi:MAG: hypothetical protein JSW11_03315 [Candidatus Heimdallarchaeota archaeon]|nr:MAG: hypothetical protein JSW11_03315 [Candidatus Heimdallarchaeota archaeon]
MATPKVISIYSRTPSCGKKTIALNFFLAYTQSKPGFRVLIVDFSRTEKLRYSLFKYGKSHFTSTDFLSEISEDTLVSESLSIFEDKDKGSFVRVLPSSGVPITQIEIQERTKYRVNSLFFKDTIDLLAFILPVSLDEKSITTAAILQSDMVWIISSEKYPTFNLTKSTIQNFLSFLTTPTLVIMNMMKPPVVFGKLDRKLELLETKLRHPIFYTIPWISELYEFSDQGIYYLELPHSEVNETFQDLSQRFQDFTEKEEFGRSNDGTEASPIALFITDLESGSTMYYYFFGKAEDEMKNPVLITAALTSIAHMVSETAGRRGDLRYIDNGNMKIVQRKGKKVIGILYSPVMNDTLTDLLFRVIERFEKDFKEAIIDFSKTGSTGGFRGVTKVVEEIFEPFVFDIDTVNEQLRQNILTYGAEINLLRGDPERLFHNYVQENYSDPKIKDLLLYEFTTSHNSRHEYLLELGINPRPERQKLEEETGRKICTCTAPPQYIQIQPFDTLGILDLPEKLRPTIRALLTSKVLSPESSTEITKRGQDLELECLEELRKRGYVKRVSPTNSELHI